MLCVYACTHCADGKLGGINELAVNTMCLVYCVCHQGWSTPTLISHEKTYFNAEILRMLAVGKAHVR